MSMSRHPGFRWMTAAREMWWESTSYHRYHQTVDTAKRPFLDYIELWYWRLLRIRNEATRLSPASYSEIRLEDLIEWPEETLKRVASFVRVSAPEDWLTDAVDIIDTDRIRCHAKSIPADELKPWHRDLLTALGYDIPPKRPIRRMKDAIGALLH